MAPIQTFKKVEVGIVIKALNEQVHIEKSIQSALDSTKNMDAIVVLADSGSRDRTIELASRYDIRIVQLKDATEKSCGIGAQLGFQFMDCDFIYILDGDMELHAGFLEQGIAALKNDPQLAGVGGIVEEMGEGNYEFEKRKLVNDGAIAGTVESLDMGGLYKASVIQEVGYLTNRNLHSYEEKELALRVIEKGYRLERMKIKAVLHYGKTAPTGQLLAHRWKSRHLDGPGEMCRAYLRTSLAVKCLSQFWNIVIVAFSIAAAPFALVVLPWTLLPLLFFLLAHLLLFIRFFWKNKSVRNAMIAYLNINVIALAFLRGFWAQQKNPNQRIDAVILQ